MNISRPAIAAVLGLSLTLLLLWLLSLAPDVAQAGIDTIHLAATGSGSLAQGNTATLHVASSIISNNAGPCNSMAVDSDGRLHVSFNNATSDGLFYAVYSDTAWHVQAVDTGGTISRTSIAVDPNSGAPHISYERSRDLVYAHLSGGEWLSSTVVSGTHRHRQNAIAVDGNGYPHIAYSTDWRWGYWFGDVEYARWNGSDWEFTTVYTHGEEVRSPISLALDGEDAPQILFKKRYWGGRFGVLLQTWVSPTWELRELERGYYPAEAPDQFPKGVALTIDDNGNSYWTYMWHGQKVSGTSTLNPTLLASGEEIGYSDIATDGVGRLYVVFENSNTLQLAVKLGCCWVQTPLVSISEWGQSDVSLAVTQDVVHAIYYDGATQSLKHLGLPVVSLIPALKPSFSLLVDDFVPQPYRGDSVYYFNRLGGDRGDLGGSVSDWGRGQVTATIVTPPWGGVWLSLNHPIRERQPINFSAVLPPQVLPQYQSEITGLTVRVARGTLGRPLRMELKNDGSVNWSQQVALTGGPQALSYPLSSLTDTDTLLWLIDDATAGDDIAVEHVALTVTTPITDVARAGFVWSYGMLLNNWNSATGLVRDKAREASGEFDAIQATGSLAAATAVAEQLGVVGRADAVAVVSAISDTLLTAIPRYHGLWPHWVEILPSGKLTIVTNTEWSSVDTVIAAIALLDAQSALGLDTSGTEQMLQDIEWDALLTPDGISMGYTYAGTRISSTWDTFGGESWLVELAYAAATHKVAPLMYPTPPTANGSGFIDELAWLFVRPPSVKDCWGTDWSSYRRAAADAQVSYYCTYYPTSCFCQLGLFGLSAAEVPVPSAVAKEAIYQAFGVGGRFTPANDGSSLLGAPVVVPHHSAMIASLRPTETISMWMWLINQGPFSPLNNVESLRFAAGAAGCTASEMEWNHLKGSWNLALQTLGWGRYLAEQRGQVPVLWQATTANAFLRGGYGLLVPSRVYLPLVLKD